MPPIPPDQQSPYAGCATADINHQFDRDRREPLIPQHAARPPPVDLDRVMPFAVWCTRCGFSEATGRRLLASGKGPRVTRLSERRIGVRERDYLAWLDQRADDPGDGRAGADAA
jgi:predicted DNA-binding transcriptional regulator AlpA